MKKLRYKRQDPKSFSGMEAWGDTFELVTCDTDPVKELYIGFVLQEHHAAEVVRACNNHQMLVDAIREMMDEAGDSRGRCTGDYISDIGSKALEKLSLS